MTTFQRFEQDIPRLMDELAPPQLPDYFDDMLRRTARTSQRPAWASLERWLPMTSTTRAVSLRPLSVGGIVLILLLLLALAAAVFVAGSRLLTNDPASRLTGLVMANSSDGGIVAIDPGTGAIRPIVGNSADAAPVIAPDGTQLAFMRGRDVIVANVDGSNQRTVTRFDGGWDETVAWSPDSTMLQGAHSGTSALRPDLGYIFVLSLIDVASGNVTDLDLGLNVKEGTVWRPGTSQLIVSASTRADDGKTELYGLWIVNADGSGLRPIVEPVANEQAWMGPVVSPDGRLVASTVWDADAGLDGRVRVIDIDAGTVTTPALTGTAGEKNEFVKAFSPDGSRLLIERYFLNDDGHEAYRLGLVPVSGGDAMLIGPDMGKGEGGSDAAFSPDGTHILVRYGQDGSTWLLDAVEGGEGTKVDWPIADSVFWGAEH